MVLVAEMDFEVSILVQSFVCVERHITFLTTGEPIRVLNFLIYRSFLVFLGHVDVNVLRDVSVVTFLGYIDVNVLRGINIVVCLCSFVSEVSDRIFQRR